MRPLSDIEITVLAELTDVMNKARAVQNEVLWRDYSNDSDAWFDLMHACAKLFSCDALHEQADGMRREDFFSNPIPSRAARVAEYQFSGRM